MLHANDKMSLFILNPKERVCEHTHVTPIILDEIWDVLMFCVWFWMLPPCGQMCHYCELFLSLTYHMAHLQIKLPAFEVWITAVPVQNDLSRALIDEFIVLRPERQAETERDINLSLTSISKEILKLGRKPNSDIERWVHKIKEEIFITLLGTRSHTPAIHDDLQWPFKMKTL